MSLMLFQLEIDEIGEIGGIGEVGVANNETAYVSSSEEPELLPNPIPNSNPLEAAEQEEPMARLSQSCPNQNSKTLPINIKAAGQEELMGRLSQSLGDIREESSMSLIVNESHYQYFEQEQSSFHVGSPIVFAFLKFDTGAQAGRVVGIGPNSDIRVVSEYSR